MSVKTALIMRCSACLTAISSPFVSQSHCKVAGAEQMAQSGSIFMVGGLRGEDPALRRLRCLLINIVVECEYGMVG